MLADHRLPLRAADLGLADDVALHAVDFVEGQAQALAVDLGSPHFELVVEVMVGLEDDEGLDVPGLQRKLQVVLVDHEGDVADGEPELEVVEIVEDGVGVSLIELLLGEEAGYFQVGHVLNVLELEHVPLYFSLVDAVDEQPVLLQLHQLLQVANYPAGNPQRAKLVRQLHQQRDIQLRPSQPHFQRHLQFGHPHHLKLLQEELDLVYHETRPLRC